MNAIANTPSLYSQFCEKAIAKRERRKTDLAKTFETAGIKFVSRKKGAHLILHTQHGLIDFFPESGKWVVRLTDQHGRGTQTLINFVNE